LYKPKKINAKPIKNGSARFIYVSVNALIKSVRPKIANDTAKCAF